MRQRGVVISGGGTGGHLYPALVLGRKLRSVAPELALTYVGTRRDVEQKIMAEHGVQVPHLFGTMIEIPRAALTAGKIAKEAEFFSFGTNDLTQTTYGISRDDAETGFLVHYLQTRLLKDNPFATIDPGGVGRLMQIAIDEGRQRRPDLEIGVCGEHGGDPKSIHLCHRIGVDYVSCSPYQVPIARLAVAQLEIEKLQKKG